MWEPFSEPARSLIVSAQQIAKTAGHGYIGTEHILCALVQSDSEVGRLVAGAVDRAAIEANCTNGPGAVQEMAFSQDAKRVIEIAFENARRLGDMYIGTKHLALGILDITEPSSLLPGTDIAALRTALDSVAESPNISTKVWRQVAGDAHLHSVAASLHRSITSSRELMQTGTRVTLSIALPDEPERSWTWRRGDEGAT
ncbi:MAG: hypothetical protein GIW94_04360 [Candidatus Eremiobacteraeota bacterium]|nr:hypothetical protein [Candidatus Eremiobacteraeota bacterium]